jgi:hypothetical protein
MSTSSLAENAISVYSSRFPYLLFLSDTARDILFPYALSVVDSDRIGHLRREGNLFDHIDLLL